MVLIVENKKIDFFIAELIINMHFLAKKIENTFKIASFFLYLLVKKCLYKFILEEQSFSPEIKL